MLTGTQGGICMPIFTVACHNSSKIEMIQMSSGEWTDKQSMNKHMTNCYSVLKFQTHGIIQFNFKNMHS